MGRLEPGQSDNGDDIRKRLEGDSPAAKWCRENGHTPERIQREAYIRCLARYETPEHVEDLFKDLMKTTTWSFGMSHGLAIEEEDGDA